MSLHGDYKEAFRVLGPECANATTHGPKCHLPPNLWCLAYKDGPTKHVSISSPFIIIP